MSHSRWIYVSRNIAKSYHVNYSRPSVIMTASKVFDVCKSLNITNRQNKRIFSGVYECQGIQGEFATLGQPQINFNHMLLPLAAVAVA